MKRLSAQKRRLVEAPRLPFADVASLPRTASRTDKVFMGGLFWHILHIGRYQVDVYRKQGNRRLSLTLKDLREREAQLAIIQ